MTRLTNDMRGDIVHALMEHTFNDEVRVLCDERAGIARSVYELHYGADLMQMDKLKKGWLTTDSAARFRSGGCDHTYAFSGRFPGVYGQIKGFEANKRTNVDLRYQQQWYGRSLQVFEPDHDIAVRVEIHQSSVSALSDRIKNAHAQAAATLDQFYTVEKLLEAWPEIKPFIPEAKRPAPALPAVPVAALNVLFDLPVGDI